ncbi:16S rRNA (guanine(966)-N(2))-methyltransferase RsmD [Kineothrix sedimenti]|uniref:16S rRNA (Guanine(966)-N(2))-methyltransferase RsmD n=1 Tax=Kineothrix sedimenti TaxID=3123317 RepID=A0ABZ3F1B3_9FIRM
MRVIAGTARSLRLKTVDGLNTRPTTDRIKETLFNMLQPYVADSIFIDLFSGSGGIGIEALSRGAQKAYFVESGKDAFSCITHNVSFTGFEDKAVLLKQDVLTALSMFSEKEADIIFMDPPYASGAEKEVLLALSDKPYVTENTLIVVEATLETDFSYLNSLEDFGLKIWKTKNYKTNKHVFIIKEGTNK